MSATQPDPLERIATANKAAGAAKDELREAVAAARRADVTWAAIGAVLGITRQSAFKRFGKNDPDTH